LSEIGRTIKINNKVVVTSAFIKYSFYKVLYYKTNALSCFCTLFGRPLNFYGCGDPVETSQPFAKNLESLRYYVKTRKFMHFFFRFQTQKQRRNRYKFKIKNKNKKFFGFNKIKKRPLYYLIFKKKANNYFVCLVNGNTRKLIKYFSAGLVGFTGPKRSSPKAAFETAAAMARYISRKFKKKVPKNFIFVLKTPVTKELSEMFFAIQKFAPWLSKKTAALFTNFKFFHGGGLRPKKQRRLLSINIE